MMAQPSGAPVFPPFSVISPQFITPEPIEIIVNKYPGRNLMITDINHTIMFRVKECKTNRLQLALLDANEKPIVMLQKAFSLHNRWNVFKGESVSDSDMIFTAKTETMKFKASVIMMLANKMRSKDVCDLRIKGSWSMGNITIYKGDSSTVVAQMHKPQETKYAKNKFTATIQPNMDYACVVALFAIVEYEENPTLIGAAAKIKSYENAIDTAGNFITKK
ncbi:putative tubby-like protein [Helianthus annuus]|nr:putative tubby-like protein [Helianthus annuus]